ncbi:MAG: sigma-70 family RNA polymerase sigma factor [Rhodanobacteraceae bacterium]|nr:sigma-70 family RNA polymerase sigma factor [Rhodanobacteraceae bacterium]
MAEFPSTQWSLIRGSALSQVDRRGAFAALARAYQPAMRAYLRARLGADEAEDALQAFLTQSWEHAWFSRADPEFGSFRGFLLVMLKRHVGHWRDKRRLATDEIDVDAPLEDADPASDPQRAFDSRFLVALTQQGLDRLRAAYAARGRREICDALLPLLASPPAKGDLAELSQRLGVPANTLAVELKRLRERLAGAMREALAELCVDAATAEREWQQLRR